MRGLVWLAAAQLEAAAAGQRIKLTSALGALVATVGLYLLVHLPGAWWSGWNRGDLETLVCAILCAVHIVLMGVFARRTDAWLLAGTQVVVAGLISGVITIFLPTPYGYQNALTALSQPGVLGPTIYLAVLSTVFAFWGQAIAQTQLGPAEAAVLFCIEPVSAALLSTNPASQAKPLTTTNWPFSVRGAARV